MEGIQTPKRTSPVIRWRLLPQGDGIEAEIQSFATERIDCGETLLTLLPQCGTEHLGVRAQRRPHTRGERLRRLLQDGRSVSQEGLQMGKTYVDLQGCQWAVHRITKKRSPPKA